MNVTVLPWYSLPLIVQHEEEYQRSASLAHDDECVSIIINIPDVFLAGASAVQDETDLLVPVFNHFVDHEGELEDISNKFRVSFIEEWHVVRLGHCDRQIEHGEAVI